MQRHCKDTLWILNLYWVGFLAFVVVGIYMYHAQLVMVRNNSAPIIRREVDVLIITDYDALMSMDEKSLVLKAI